MSYVVAGTPSVQAELVDDGGSLVPHTTAKHEATDAHILAFSLDVDAAPLVPLLGQIKPVKRTFVRLWPAITIRADGKVAPNRILVFDVYVAKPGGRWHLVPERQFMFLERPEGLAGLVLDRVVAWLETDAALPLLLDATRQVRRRFEQEAQRDPTTWSRVPNCNPVMLAKRATSLEAALERRIATNPLMVDPADPKPTTLESDGSAIGRCPRLSARWQSVQATIRRLLNGRAPK